MAITQVDEANGEVLAKTASRDGTSIGYWRSGQGRPMVLVHGTTADHSRWRTVLPLLQPHATVHAVDRRGRGAVIVGATDRLAELLAQGASTPSPGSRRTAGRGRPKGITASSPR
ncbi:MAG TPA: alpha/beta fold hydrolase [Nocardioidaceae bacterium]|nr:alpha/beta fold hydrolase [Nocardioidaceae bacterium]